MSRGITKLIVSAAHSVTTKNSRRRRTALMRPPTLPEMDLRQDDSEIGCTVRARVRVRLVLRRPAGEDLLAPLVPVDTLDDGDDGHLVEHDLLDAVHGLALAGRVARGRVLAEQLVGLGRLEALVVRLRDLADRRRVRAVEQVLELVVGGDPGADAVP